MMLCHGGAGVVNACLRAGIPAVVSPLMGDQFFWAELLVARGIGAKAGTMPTLTPDVVARGIRDGMGCRDAARALGEMIRSQHPSGVAEMRLLLEKVTAAPGNRAKPKGSLLAVRDENLGLTCILV